MVEPAGLDGQPGVSASTSRLVLGRLASLPLLLAGVTLVMFVLASAAPFDPVLALLGERALTMDGPTLEAMRARYEDVGPVRQWLAWWAQAAQGDLGVSTSQRARVTTVLAERLPWTLGLMTAALALAVVAGVALGAYLGTHPGTAVDRVLGAGLLALQAAPAFWLGLVGIWLVAVTWGLLPTGGATTPGADGVGALDVARHAVLPVVILALSQLPWLALVVRDATRDALAGPAVRAAWARGVPGGRLLAAHAVRPALLPLVTVIGVRVPELITGAVLVESVFSWPGIAAATVDSALRLDFALLAALTALTTVIVVLGNLAADVLYRVVDPRLGAADG